TPTSPNPRRLSDYQTSLVIPSLPDYSDPLSPKPRQNTAERRASHNAVERARRETLNARFLDLAALLPNLKHLRRPSKSAIVNSSIAHARATRRYRHLAGVHAPASTPPSRPARSEGFLLVLGGEEPAFDPVDLEGEDDEDADYRGVLSHRRPQPAEPVCEGPLLLSDPYARTSPPPTYDASAAAAAPASHTPPPSTQGYHGHPSPHSHSASPVAASLEVPNPQQQGDEWAFAQGQCHPAW
ncbi:hypothetical protein B0H14DRAFT_2928461, partial [Mycena olivaceomarginata]